VIVARYKAGARPPRRPEPESKPDGFRSNEEQLADIKAEFAQAAVDAKAGVAKMRSGVLGLWRGRPIPPAPRAAFFSEMGKCLEATLPLSECFAALSPAARTGRMGDVVEDLAMQARKGKTLLAAMKQWPEAFSAFDLQLVEAAERAGRQPVVFAELGARWRGRATILNTAVGDPRRSAALIAAGLFIFLAPLPMRGIGDYLLGLIGTALFVALILGADLLLSLWLLQSRPARHKLFEILARVPPIRSILEKRRDADFAAALWLGLGCKLLARQAVRVAADLADDPQLPATAAQVISRIDAGQALPAAVKQTRGMPSELVLALAPDDGKLISSLGVYAESARSRFVESASRIGRGMHFGSAALILALGIVAAMSGPPGAEKAGAVAEQPTPNATGTAAGGSGDAALDKAGRGLQRRLTGQKSADDRARRALGE